MAELVQEFMGSFLLIGAFAFMKLDHSSEMWSVTIVALIFMAMVASLQAHMNPVITLGLALCKKFPWRSVPEYLVVQFIAAASATSFAKLIFKGTTVVAPEVNFFWYQTMAIETFYTAMLIFVMLNSLCRASVPGGVGLHFGVLAIAGAIVAAGFSAGPVGGGHINPIVTLSNILVFFTGPVAVQGILQLVSQVLGGIVGVLMFATVRRPEEVKLAGSGPTGMAREPTLASQLAAEFIGAFMISLTVCLNIMGKSTATPLAAAAALVALTCSLEDVSGGLFNPATTLAVAVLRYGGLHWKKACGFVIAQVAGGILAGTLYCGVYNAQSFALKPQAQYRESAAYVLELMFTLVLSIIYLTTITAQREQPLKTSYFSLAMGGALLACSAASLPVSGGSLNPALSVGMGIANAVNFGSFKYPAIYACFQLLGGAVAAAMFLVLHAAKYPEQLQKQDFYAEQSLAAAPASARQWQPKPAPAPAYSPAPAPVPQWSIPSTQWQSTSGPPQWQSMGPPGSLSVPDSVRLPPTASIGPPTSSFAFASAAAAGPAPASSMKLHHGNSEVIPA